MDKSNKIALKREEKLNNRPTRSPVAVVPVHPTDGAIEGPIWSQYMYGLTAVKERQHQDPRMGRVGITLEATVGSRKSKKATCLEEEQADFQRTLQRGIRGIMVEFEF